MTPASQPSPRAATAATPLRLGGFGSTLARVLAVTFLGIAPVLWVGALVVKQSIFDSTNLPNYFDFHAFWNAGQAALHGRNPYPPARTSVLAHETAFVYPAPAAVLMIPLALLPFRVAATIFALALIAALPLALRIVGVRDWRCYGIAVLAGPILLAIKLDAISPLLAVLVAVAWRYRDRLWLPALAIALAVVLKLFLWPFVLWLAFTGRRRSALLSVALIAGSSLVCWAILGFHGLLAYPRLIHVLSDLLDGKGYSIVSFGRSLGLAATPARVLPWVLGAMILAAVGIIGRRPNGDQPTFVLTLAAALALSPIVWLHYFVLLSIPIGIASPRLSPLWAVQLPLFVIPGQSDQHFLWEPAGKQIDEALTARVGDPALIIYALVVALAVIVLTLRPSTRATTRATPALQR